MFLEELYRAFWNRAFLLTLILGVLSLILGLVAYAPKYIPGADPFLNNAYDAWLWAHEGPHVLLAPLLAVLPFADSYALDRTQGYLRHVLIRVSRTRYFLAKFLANLLAGGLAIVLPYLAVFIYTSFAYPRGLAPVAQSRIPFDPLPGPLGYLYRQAPDFYILFLIGLGFVFGAAYATLGLAISSLINNRYLVLATPFLLYHIANFVLAVLGLEAWTPPVTLIAHAVKTASWLTVFGELGGIFIISAVWFLALAKRDDVHG